MTKTDQNAKLIGINDYGFANIPQIKMIGHKCIQLFLNVLKILPH